MCYHFLVRELISVCALDHPVQDQNVAVGFAETGTHYVGSWSMANSEQQVPDNPTSHLDHDWFQHVRVQ